MPKSGQARVPTPEEWQRVFEVIRDHRHPEKNSAIMQISAKLGLRAQEIALLQIKEVARLKKSPPGFTLYKVMSLPAAYTKGANAMGRSAPQYTRRTVSFSVEAFDQVVAQIVDLANAGVEVDPKRFYPAVKKRSGKSRDLPLVDEALRDALTAYLAVRLEKHPDAKPTDPLFITQKGVAYSPNTLQEHMALILRGWAGIEKASSHSGRRSVITDIIHKQKKSLKVAQKVAGHKSASTTVIYDEPPEEAISDALKNLS
ncbi:site-specific integrase [Haliea sp.]|jgi:integrase|uniref:site-specific integrase n=1 Tax=Haliea sp. TaxID=1932666 RepID=UPI000C681E63|nr:site-specific integrase [Haliea sp.]MAD65534.1 integrase [Haliea sp.]MAY91821.1 integrase [Haliea sp.]MBK40262.1 integrase [Haliea sp.]MBP68845.1 integrase [Haliea sp.]|tara:strand:+ start:14540 stop:15313 length:774 start_codon:yes stop_codon:yes gene_type:complete